MGTLEAPAAWREEESGAAMHFQDGSSASSSSQDFVSPLALKLQQVWLQTQLQKTLSLETSSIASRSIRSASNSTNAVERNESELDLGGILSILMDDDFESGEVVRKDSVLSFEQELRDLIHEQPNTQEDGNQGFIGEQAATGTAEDVSVQLVNAQETCCFSTNVVDFDENYSTDDDFDFTDAVSPIEGAWMTETPSGLEWPKQERQQTQHLGSNTDNCSSSNRGSYYQVLEGLGLKNLELVEQLVECAKAVSVHDVTKANILVEEIRSTASPFGTCTQRLVHYFVEALVARMSATGNGLFTAMCYAKPRAAAMLKAVDFLMGRSPFLTVRYFFPNRVILNACRGHSRIHIVDYGMEFGFQWPALMQELLKTPGGPPHLRITGIDSPLPGFGIAQEVGGMLREYAQSIDMPFKFRSVSNKWEHIDAAMLQLRVDEVLVVNCMFRQTNLLDESVLAESPRKIWLNRVRSLNPKVFVQGMNNASYNVPFFMTRFLEALTHYAIFFDAVDHCAAADCTERLKLEQEKLCREIVNVVACEGLERVQRAETYKQWHSRTQRAKFRLLDIEPSVFKETESLMGRYHQDFCLQKDEGWLLLGWKGQILHVFSAWTPV